MFQKMDFFVDKLEAPCNFHITTVLARLFLKLFIILHQFPLVGCSFRFLCFVQRQWLQGL